MLLPTIAQMGFDLQCQLTCAKQMVMFTDLASKGKVSHTAVGTNSNTASVVGGAQSHTMSRGVGTGTSMCRGIMRTAAGTPSVVFSV